MLDSENFCLPVGSWQNFQCPSLKSGSLGWIVLKCLAPVVFLSSGIFFFLNQVKRSFLPLCLLSLNPV